MKLLVSRLLSEDHPAVFAASVAVVEPAANASVASSKCVKAKCGRSCVPAMVGQRTLGQHEIGAAGDAEVGAPVADHDAHGAPRRHPRTGTCSCRTAPGSRRARAETSAASDRRRPSGGDWRERAGRSPRASTVPTVRSRPSETTEDVEIALFAGVDKSRKARIDFDRRDKVVVLARRRLNQIDLADHAFARADTAGFPVVFDLQPAGLGEPFEQEVRRIDGCDCPVEIDEYAALQTCTRHVAGTL